MKHGFLLNGHITDRWGMSFSDGVYRELLQAPTKKMDPLSLSWSDQDGTEADRTYNKYESKSMSLPVFIEADSEEQLLLNYNQFVNEVLTTGQDIILDCTFLKRRFVLRYRSTSNTFWSENVVSFNIEVFDDYPATLTPIPQ